MMKRFLPVAALALLLLSPLARADERPLTVVEMFTSQGCSSCPPADVYLGQLAKRPDIVALSMHVDYWDYIGWKDPFALPINVTRQRAYAGKLGSSYVYTPQAVIQGMAHATGSDRGTVERLIKDLSGAKRVGVTAAAADGAVRIEIAGGVFPGETATVYLAAYDAKHETAVRRGENAGHTLAYTNVVMDMAKVGAWTGDAARIDVPAGAVALDGHDGAVVLVQSAKTGRILGATRVSGLSGT